MKAEGKPAATVDEYIAGYPPAVRAILERVRRTIRKAAPDAEEKLSYRMPSFHLHGALVYFGAFKEHIGLYPPVGDSKLRREAAVYAGEKGNLRFPLAEPMPVALIARIVRARLRENQERARGWVAKRAATARMRAGAKA